MKTYISWFRTKLFPSALKSSSSHYACDELEALIVVVLPRVFNRHRLHLELQSFDSEVSLLLLGVKPHQESLNHWLY